MGAHKWSDLMKKRYSPEQIAESRANAVRELQRVYVTSTDLYDEGESLCTDFRGAEIRHSS